MKNQCRFRPFLTTSCLLFCSVTSLPTVTSETQTSTISHPSSRNKIETTDSVTDSTSDDIADEIVREAISSSRGYRDEPGKRDQWDSTEHVGSRSSYDVTWRPPSPRTERVLKLYRLNCEGCSDDEAVSKINAYVVRTKKELKEKQRREWWISWGKRILWVVALVLSFLVSLYFLTEEREERERMAGPIKSIAEPVVVRRPDPSPPTWIDNEKKEIWTPKQEKQFQKALREFGAVEKKERYVLIAAQVTGKSRIECLTHHRMQQLTEQWEREKKIREQHEKEMAEREHSELKKEQ